MKGRKSASLRFPTSIMGLQRNGMNRQYHFVSPLQQTPHTLMNASSKSILNQRSLNREAREPGKLSGWLILLAILGGGVMFVFFATASWKSTAVIVGMLVGLGWMASLARSWKLGKLAAARPGESICQFARAFDLQRYDAVLIRAVYETIQEQVGRPLVPIRADDRLFKDLALDDDDLIEILAEASWLTGRSLENIELNPLAERVLRVRHLVEFLHRQSAAVAS
jgi:hypothetical protein